jgi:sirohydrochlorin cobaltochelatase
VLILIAHGSRDPAWRASVESVMAALDAELGPGQVRLAYMELMPPTLGDVVADAARDGIERIRVLPLFLARQGHVDRDVVPQVETVRAAYPQVRIDLLPPIGQLEGFRELLRRIALERESGNGNRESAPVVQDDSRIPLPDSRSVR